MRVAVTLAVKLRNLSFREGFRVHRGNRRSEAAEMVIAPGDAEGDPRNRHRGADQWLFVVSGTGLARVNGRRHALRRGAGEQARPAVDSRAFPIRIYDPRKGDKVKERLSLQGNPAVKEDWFVNPKTSEAVTFIDFARSEGRFAKHFDKDGNPSELLLWAKQERLENWRLLQELAGLR